MSASTNDDISLNMLQTERKLDKRKKVSKSCAPERSLGRKINTAVKYESEDDESFSSDDQSDDLIEVGPPKFLRYLAEIKGTQDQNNLMLNEQDKFPKSFYCKDLKDFLKGGFTCDFCQSTSLPWPSFHDQAAYNCLESYCCLEYKEYGQGLLDHHIYMETIRKKMRFDFRTMSFKAKVNKIVLKAKFDDLKLNEKFYSNSLLSTMTSSENSKKSRSKNNKDKQEKMKNEKGRSSKDLKEKEKGRNSMTSKNSKEKDEEDDLDDEENVENEFDDPEDIFKKRRPHTRERQTNSTFSKHSISADDKKRNQQINYFLSNIKYIEKGWTQNLNYEQFGLTFDESKAPEYRIDSGNASTTIDIWTCSMTSPIMKYYKNGKIFQAILPDRTGNIYYPNGGLAFLLSNSGEYRNFIAFDHDSKNSSQIASFDSNGNGFCNYPNGKLRYQINYIGGINFDQSGNCIKKWLFPEDPDGQSFHPIRFIINEYMSIQIHSRSRIIFIFRSKYGTCRFLIKLKNLNKYSDRYDSHFKCFFSDATYLKLKNRTELLLQLIQEATEQTNQNKPIKMLKCREKSIITPLNIPKFKLPRLSTQKSPLTNASLDRSSHFENSHQHDHNSKLLVHNVAKLQGHIQKSGTNSINFSLHSSSYNQ